MKFFRNIFSFTLVDWKSATDKDIFVFNHPPVPRLRYTTNGITKIFQNSPLQNSPPEALQETFLHQDTFSSV